MTLFILHHLLAVTVTFGVCLLGVFAFQAGFTYGRRIVVPGAAPTVRLVWAADTPVAVVANPEHSRAVAEWLAAAKEGTVLRV